MADIFTVSTRVGSDGSMEWFDKATGNTVFAIGNVNGNVQYKKVTLTSANMLALHGTPVTVLAAPGAGKFIELIDVLAFLNFNTAAYAAGSVFQLLMNSVAVATTSAALINGGAAAMLQLAFPSIGTTASLGGLNAALTATASAGEFTTGDSTVNLHLWYSIVTA